MELTRSFTKQTFTDLITRPMLLESEDSISTNKCSFLGVVVSRSLRKGAIERNDMVVSDFCKHSRFDVKEGCKSVTNIQPHSTLLVRKCSEKYCICVQGVIFAPRTSIS